MNVRGLLLTLVSASVDDQDAMEAHGLLQATRVHAEALGTSSNIQQDVLSTSSDIQQATQGLVKHSDIQQKTEVLAQGSDIEQKTEVLAKDLEIQEGPEHFDKRGFYNLVYPYHKYRSASDCPSLGCFTADDAHGRQDMSVIFANRDEADQFYRGNGLAQCQHRCDTTEGCNVFNFAVDGSDATSGPGRCCCRKCPTKIHPYFKTVEIESYELTDKWKGWDIYERAGTDYYHYWYYA